MLIGLAYLRIPFTSGDMGQKSAAVVTAVFVVVSGVMQSVALPALSMMHGRKLTLRTI